MYLQELLDRAEKNHMIDPSLMHYVYASCSSYVHGNRLVTAPEVRDENTLIQSIHHTRMNQNTKKQRNSLANSLNDLF